MTDISIFPGKPVEFTNISRDPQNAAYHFDAVMKYSMDLKAKYTRFPVEFGVDMQDHAYNEPTALTLYGYTGSKELSISVNNLPELGASAVVGNINNPILSAAAGIAGAAYLAGKAESRGGATLAFLNEMKSQFTRFDIVVGLGKIPGLKIDSIHVPVDPNNETGLEFVVEMSQLFVVGEDKPSALEITDAENADSAILQSSPVLERGRIALV